MKYTIAPAARLDLERIAEFYAQERRELAARFVGQLDDALRLLQAHPEIGERVGETHRRFPLHGFPYFVIYRLDGPNDPIRIVAISHQRRRPGYWVSRVEELAPEYPALQKVA